MAVSTQPTTDHQNARWIWPFEILEQIGEGGMGVVYRARYVVNDRQVALKMLPTDVIDKTALARFERELEVLKTLRHPNIVYCFGGSCENKRRFYAMELLEGGSLEDELRKKGRLPWEQVVQYGLQMCAALTCSHGKGVIHRDIKPSNFLLHPSGQLKLSDFGLASVMAARRITASGKTAGTFLYMAPEQIRGQEVTPRTDLYALGCVLYELVTGDVPFLGETPGATLHLHCYTPPVRPTEKAMDCPVSLEQIILHLMEKDPEKRPQSAEEVARALRGVSQTVTVVGSRSELDREFPVGYREQETSPAAAKTAPAPTYQGPREIPFWLQLSLGLLIAVILIGNVFSFVAAHQASGWRTAWLTAATDETPEVRAAAMAALGSMAGDDDEALTALTHGLDDPNERVRAAAANGLAAAGEPARSSLPQLTKLRNTDPSPSVRTAVQAAQDAIKNANPRWSFPWAGALFLVILVAAIGAGVHYGRRMMASASLLP